MWRCAHVHGMSGERGDHDAGVERRSRTTRRSTGSPPVNGMSSEARHRDRGRLDRVEAEDVVARGELAHLDDVHRERDRAEEREHRAPPEAVARAGEQREADDGDPDRDDGGARGGARGPTANETNGTITISR